MSASAAAHLTIQGTTARTLATAQLYKPTWVISILHTAWFPLILLTILPRYSENNVRL